MRETNYFYKPARGCGERHEISDEVNGRSFLPLNWSDERLSSFRYGDEGSPKVVMKALLLLTRGRDEGTSLSPEVMKALLPTRGGDEGAPPLFTLTLTCSYPVIL